MRRHARVVFQGLKVQSGGVNKDLPSFGSWSGWCKDPSKRYLQPGQMGSVRRELEVGKSSFSQNKRYCFSLEFLFHGN